MYFRDITEMIYRPYSDYNHSISRPFLSPQNLPLSPRYHPSLIDDTFVVLPLEMQVRQLRNLARKRSFFDI